jgi:hypothetical protein
MTDITKSILRNSINVFIASTDKEKENYIVGVEKNLKDHRNALNSIGMGCNLDIVNAGELFLRIFKQ